MKYRNYRVIRGEESKWNFAPGLSPSGNGSYKKEVMKENENMESRLWDYIDGLSSPEEKSAIAELIRENRAWQEKYRELLDFHQLMNQSDLEMPSLRFTRNVMEEISRHQVAPATKSYLNKKIIWGVAIFFLVMITGFLIYGFSQVNWAASDGSSVINKELGKIPRFDWSKFLNNTYTNIFMMVNVVLGLVLLDMYLQRRKEKARAENV